RAVRAAWRCDRVAFPRSNSNRRWRPARRRRALAGIRQACGGIPQSPAEKRPAPLRPLSRGGARLNPSRLPAARPAAAQARKQENESHEGASDRFTNRVTQVSPEIGSKVSPEAVTSRRIPAARGRPRGYFARRALPETGRSAPPSERG